MSDPILPSHTLLPLPVVAERFLGQPLAIVPAYDDVANTGGFYRTDADGAPSALVRFAGPANSTLGIRLAVGEWLVLADPTRPDVPAVVYSDAAFQALYAPIVPPIPPELEWRDETPPPAEALAAKSAKKRAH